MDGLSFPFVELSDMEIAFGGVPNYSEVIAACPTEFHHQNEWSESAMYLFNHGFSPEQLNKLEFKTDREEIAVAQARYYHAWLRSFYPPHEVKAAVVGWLFSLMLSRCPDFST